MIAALRRWLARIVGPLVIALTLGRVRVDWTGAESTARPDDGPAMMATETVEQAEDAGAAGRSVTRGRRARVMTVGLFCVERSAAALLKLGVDGLIGRGRVDLVGLGLL